MKNLSRTVLRNSAFGFATQIATKIASFLFNIWVIRYLGAEKFGQYTAINSIGATFIFLADLGLSVYAIRQIAQWREKPAHNAELRQFTGNVLGLRIALSLVAAGVMLFFAFASGRSWDIILGLILVAISWLLYAFQGSYDAMLSGYERLDITSSAKILYQIVLVALGVMVVLVLGLGYHALIAANLLAIALLTWICWRGARDLGIRPSLPTPRQWPAIIRACIPFGILTFALGLSYKFDSVLLSLYRGDTETGYYGAAYNLIFSAVVFSNVLNTSLYPSLARQATQNRAMLPSIYERAMRYLLLVSVPITIAVAVLADSLVPFLFKVQFAPAADALKILIWVVPFMYASEFLGYIVLIDGNEKHVARSVSISTVINVVINLLLIPRYGFIAAACMTVLTEVILVMQYVWLLRAPLGKMNWQLTLLRPLLAALLMGVLLYLLRGWPVFVSAAIGALCYAALLVLMRVLGRDELRFVQSLRRKEAPLPVADPKSL